MKKLNLWLFMSLFVAAFTLSACGDDDDKPADTNPLFGRWESKEPLKVDIVKVSYAFTIGADKSVKFEYRMRNNAGALHNGYNRYGTYVEDGKKITVNYIKFERVSGDQDTFDQPEQFVYTYRIENNRLFISGDDDSNGQVLQNFEFVKK